MNRHVPASHRALRATLLFALTITIAPMFDDACAQTSILTSPNPDERDFFGVALAWCGDNLVVGATYDESATGVQDAGLAYIFDGSPGSPTFGSVLAVLRSPQENAGSEFGGAIAVFGNTVLIGAPFGGLAGTGAVYAYDCDTVSPGFGNAIMTFDFPRTQSAPAEYGFALATLGSNLVVGAYRDGSLAPGAGAAFVYDADPASQSYGALLNVIDNPSPAAWDMFGVALTTVGSAEILVGAFRDDATATDAGAAYLFDGDPASPTFGALLHTFLHPEPVASGANGQNDEFGHSLAAVGGYVAIGAFRDDDSTTDSGAVYVFDADSTSSTFGQLATKLTAPKRFGYENFGFALHANSNRLYVGAWRDHACGQYAGAMYAYELARGSANFGQLIGAACIPASSVFASYGTALALSGGKFAVGAIGVGNGAGSVHLYSP